MIFGLAYMRSTITFNAVVGSTVDIKVFCPLLIRKVAGAGLT
jgi:hypothetical protein